VIGGDVVFLENGKYAIICQKWYLPREYSWAPPPDGQYILWSCCIPWPCANYDDLLPEKIDKYSICLSFGSTKKRKTFSAATKAKIREQRLTARMTKKMPLFAETAIQKKKAEKPEYFDPEQIALADVEHRAMIEKYENEMDMQYYPG
jgi:hypothetical protein